MYVSLDPPKTDYHHGYLESGFQLLTDPHLFFPPLN